MAGEHSDVLVYNYDRTEMFYLGSEKAQLCPITSEPLVPAHATLIAPPEQWPNDDIPVYNGDVWEIKPDHFWRPKHAEINYDAGRFMSTWMPKAVGFTDFPSYPDLNRLTASSLVVMRLVQNIRHVDALFDRLLQLYASIKRGVATPLDDFRDGSKSCGIPSPLYSYKFESEAIIYHMRHCLDTLCRLTELLVDGDRVNQHKQFRCDSVGALFGAQKHSKAANIVRGLCNTFAADETDFLSISNDLFNAMKHTHMNSETQILFSFEVPAITAFHAPDGAHANEIRYHNHNAYHLIMGFHDTIDRIIRNQRTFLDANS